MAQTAGRNKFEKWELPETMATLVTKQNANLEKIDTALKAVEDRVESTEIIVTNHNADLEKIDTALVEIKSASQNMNFKYETSNANLVPSDLVIAVFPLLPTNKPVSIDINRNGFHIFAQGMKTSANSGFFISGSSNHKAMQHQCHAGTWTHTAL